MHVNEGLSVIDASGRQISLLNNDTSPMARHNTMYTKRTPPPPSLVDMDQDYISPTQLSAPMPNWNVQPEESVSSGSSSGNGNGKRKYHCTEPGCNKSFTTSGHLARHNRIHTGEKNFPCLFPGCQSRFSRQDNMMQHYRTHMSPKSRKSNKRVAPPEETRPRPRLHAHHRISSDPFGVERPLTIDQHLSNYHRSLVSPERFSSVCYDGNNGTAIKTSSAESSSSTSSSTTTTSTSMMAQQSTENKMVYSMFYQHKPLSFPSSTSKTITTTLLGPSPSEMRLPIRSKKKQRQQQDQQLHDEGIEREEDESDEGESSEGLLQLAHVVSTFG